MKKQLLSLFRQYRRQGCSAGSALRAARAAVKPSRPPLDWKESGGRSVARWQQAGWRFVASTEIDEYLGPQEMALGHFSGRRQSGAIDHWARGHYPGYCDPRTFRWFIPCNSYRDHYEGLRRLNFGKHEAHARAMSYVLQDYQRARDMGEFWVAIFVCVRVLRAGVELAQTSCGGIESDCGREYLSEMAYELAAEALHQARTSAKELCADFVGA